MPFESILEQMAHVKRQAHMNHYETRPTEHSALFFAQKQKAHKFVTRDKSILKDLNYFETTVNPYFWYYREDILNESTKIAEKPTRKMSLSSDEYQETLKLPEIIKRRSKIESTLSNSSTNSDEKQSISNKKSTSFNQQVKILSKKKSTKLRQRVEDVSEGTSRSPSPSKVKTKVNTKEETQAFAKLKAGLTSGKLRYLAVSEKFIDDARKMIYNPSTQSFLPKLKQEYLRNIIVS